MKHNNVLIYTTPRTGSTFLFDVISEIIWKGKDESLRMTIPFGGYGGEPFSECKNIGKTIDECNFLAGGSNPFVLKLMHNHLQKFTDADLSKFKAMLKNRNFFVISLTREDLKNQTLSWYIAVQTKQFSEQSYHQITGDYESFSHQLNFLHENVENHKSNKYNIPIDQEMVYEKFTESDEITIDNETFSLKNILPNIKIFRALPKYEKLQNLKKVNSWYSKLMKEKNQEVFTKQS